MAQEGESPSQAYERSVMEAFARGEPAPDDALPPPDYEMSEAFREWLVNAMRKDVLAEVSRSGLDRMAVLKIDGESDDGAAVSLDEQNHEEE